MVGSRAADPAAAAPVQSLAAAVFACVQNSLDAGAAAIDVLLDVERFSFTVVDDGCGISAQALDRLAAPAAVLQAARGSLSRIVENAVVHIRSRARGSFETHTLLCTASGAATCSLSAEQQARSGTHVRVSDLLYRQPVRQKALARTPGGLAKEVEHCKELVLRLGLLRPEAAVRLRTVSQSADLLHLPRDRSTLAGAARLLGGLEHLVEIPPTCCGTVTVGGFALMPPAGHPTPERQMVYVGAQPVQCEALCEAVQALYEPVLKYCLKCRDPAARPAGSQQLLAVQRASGRHAAFVLQLSVAPSGVQLRRTGEVPLAVFASPSAVLRAVQQALLCAWAPVLPDSMLRRLESPTCCAAATPFDSTDGLQLPAWLQPDAPAAAVVPAPVQPTQSWSRLGRPPAQRRSAPLAEPSARPRIRGARTSGRARSTDTLRPLSVRHTTSSIAARYGGGSPSGGTTAVPAGGMLAPAAKRTRLDVGYWPQQSSSGRAHSPGLPMWQAQKPVEEPALPAKQPAARGAMRGLSSGSAYSTTNAAPTGRPSLDSLLAGWANPSLRPDSGTEVPALGDLQLLATEPLAPAELSRGALRSARALRQVDAKFVLVACGRVLALVDQHAADERVQLEALRDRLQAGAAGGVLSSLEVEQSLSLAPAERSLLEIYRPQLEVWGWRWRPAQAGPAGPDAPAQQAYVLTRAPVLLGTTLTSVDMLLFAHQLRSTAGAGGLPPGVVRVLNSKACRGAIMFGDELTPEQCQDLMDRLKATKLWFSCAHGRPTTTALVDLAALDRVLAAGGRSPAGAEAAQLAGLRNRLHAALH